jgi:hypothetical protein
MEKVLRYINNPEEGVSGRFLLRDGRAVDLVLRTFGRVQLAVGAADSKIYDSAW